MLSLFFFFALLAPAQEMRWFVLNPDSAQTPLQTLGIDRAQAIAKEQGWSFTLETLPAEAREIGYAGEDRGLLCHMLGMRPSEAKLWAFSPELKFRVSGLGTQVAGDRAFSRALLAPLPGKQWLLGLSPAATLEEEALHKTLQSPPAKKSLLSRLQNLLRDGHAARNAGKAKPPRLGYPSLHRNAELEVGDLESEELFEFSTTGNAKRIVAAGTLYTGGESLIDDGVEVDEGGSLAFSVDLRALISDDLILFARSASAGKAQIFVDGVPLASWEPQNHAARDRSANTWLEVVSRISNRLIGGKEKARFEIKPQKGQHISLLRLELLRLPGPHGTYLSELLPANTPGRDANAEGGPLVSGGYRFFRGLGATATSEIKFKIEPAWNEIEAFVGLDDTSPGEGPTVFQILIDGEIRAQSKPLKKGEPPQTLRASVGGGKELKLVVLSKGDDTTQKISADWHELRAIE